MSEVGRTKIVKETPYRFRIEQEGAMRVPGIVFASRSLLPDEHEDMALAQVANVATLPGIVRASYAMPDVHWGYGFPIGGVAATDIDADGVVSPGGVGFDISCGVRLLVSRVLDRDRLQPRIRAVMDHLDVAIPRGVGTKGVWRLPNRGVLKQVLAGGARFAVEQGHGVARDVERCEDGGVLEGADPATVSDRAFERGLAQIGSLGSGNHFLEVQAVDRIYDAAVAGHMGLSEGRICVMIHTGSRGLGHQICTDHVRQMGQAMGRYGIHVPDRQLACVPVRSPEGQAYLAAMAAAANYGRANRQLLTEATRRVLTGNRDIPGHVVRRVAQPRQDRGARGPRPRVHPVCASERRDPLIAAAPSRPTRRSRSGRSARADSGHDGHRVLRAGGRSR